MAQLNDLLVAGASRLLNGLGVLGNVNTDSIFPNITDTYSLGSSDKRWNLLYAKTLNTYQETTDILTVNTKATIGNGAGSTSATTGSLIVKGGIGVNANSYFGGTITSSKFIGPLQGNADSATKWKTTRTLKIGDTGKSVDGTANVTWTSSDVGYRHEWSAVVTCATWSRLCYVAYGGNVLGSSFFLNIAATRNSVVYNDTFIIKSHHSSNGKIVKISGHNYSSGYQVRLLVDSGGNCYVELYDNINGATSSTTQTVYCNLIPIYCGAITKYTSFASGATLPSGFSVKQTMTLDNNDIQANIKGNVTGNVVGNVAGNVSGSSGSCTGNSATATALTSNAGSTGQPVYFTGGKPATIDWHIGNSGVGEHNANNVTYNFCGYYTSNGPATSLGASTSDGALYAQAYSSTWVAQIAQDYRNGGLYVRGKNNGTWQSWYTVLDTRNYTGILDSRYINASGDTMTGHLYATSGLSWNNVYWAPSGNIYAQPTANGQEWSIDVGSASYTGSYFHVWSTKNNMSMLRCHADNNAVDVPSGPFTVSGGNSYFTKTIICSSQIGNYGEGIRLNCSDGKWATITMGSSGDVGTHSNCWSIHRKDDNNFAISRGSSDGYNGLVMTATGMGLGTTTPSARLHVTGDFFVYAGHSRFYTTSAGTSPGEAAIEIREVSMGTTSTTHDVAHSPRLGFHWGNRYWGQIAFFNSEFQFRGSDVNSYCNARANAFYGAVWNDYAEYRTQKETIEPGYCVASSDDGKIYKTSQKLQPCDGIVSDTFGFAIGETEESKTPLAVAGRVLAYCNGNRYDYHAGDTVCAGPEGKVMKMSRQEIAAWPDRIVGIVSEIPNYKTWGQGNVEVNGRIWIKVK